MKHIRLILVLFLVLFLAGCECEEKADAGPTFTAEDDAAIRSSLAQWAVDVLAADWTAHAGYYTADAVRMPPDAPTIQGHNAIIALMETFPPITGFTLTPQAVGGDGDLAYATGAFTLDLAPPDADPVNMVGKWTAIYKRQEDGSWLCVSDIWNDDAPAGM